MSLLDELFDNIKEDLEKVEEEERVTAPPPPAPASQNALKRPGADDDAAAHSKKPKMLPAQLMSRPPQPTRSKEVVVTSTAPTLNKEYLDEMLGIPSSAASVPRISGPPRPLAIPQIKPSRPPVAVAPVISQIKPTEELVFAPSASSSSLAQQLPSSNSVQNNDSSPAVSNPTRHGLFIGNLGPEVRDDHLARQFKEYASVMSVKAVMEHAEKCKGFGFVYFSDPFEMLKAMREKNGKLCGPRPMVVKRCKGPSDKH